MGPGPDPWHAADGAWPSADPLRVVRALTTDEWQPRCADAGRLLRDWERDRVARLRVEQDRADFVASHLLVREVVAELLGVSPAVVQVGQRCPRCRRTGHGRPQVSSTGCPPVFASWSRGSGRVAAAAAFLPVGVDVEAVDAPELSGQARALVLAPAEAAQVRAAPQPQLRLLDLWTRKEALVKVGAITLDDFGRTDLSRRTDRWGRWQLVSWHDDVRGLVAGVAHAAPRPGPRRVRGG